MTKKPGERALRREHLAKVRARVVTEIVKLEKLYGESAVSGAFNRHQQIRWERRKLTRAQAEINAKIAKLAR